MSLRKGKKKASEESAGQGLTPYAMGVAGWVDDFYAAARAADEDLAAKAAATKKSTSQYTNGRLFVTKRYHEDQAAFRAVEGVPFEMRREFHRGAFDIFDAHPEGIQHILSNPREFYRYSWGDPCLVADTLITLLDKSDAPDAVLDIALAKVADDDKQGIIDSTLLRLVHYSEINEKSVSALLKADARVLDEMLVLFLRRDASVEVTGMLLQAGAKASGEALAIAIHKGAPDAVTDMLLESGAKIDEALKVMCDNPSTYGTLPYELKILQQAAKIRDLERALAETKNDITGARDAVPSAPVARTAGTRLKVSTVGR